MVTLPEFTSGVALDDVSLGLGRVALGWGAVAEETAGELPAWVGLAGPSNGQND